MADPRAVCRAYVAGMDARSFEGLAELVTDDHRFVLNDRVTVGRDALAANCERWFAMVPDSRTTVRQLIAEGDMVVVHIEISGTRLVLPAASPDQPGTELTGPWSFPACAICTLDGDRIAEWREFCAWDTPEKLAALVTSDTGTTSAGAAS